MSEDQLSPEARAVRSKLAVLNTVLFTIIGALLLIHFFFLLFIVPKFQVMFFEMDVGELPLPTTVVFLLSNALKSFCFIVIPSFIAGAIALRKMMSTRILVIVLSVLLLGLGFYALSMFMPIVSMQENHMRK